MHNIQETDHGAHGGSVKVMVLSITRRCSAGSLEGFCTRSWLGHSADGQVVADLASPGGNTSRRRDHAEGGPDKGLSAEYVAHSSIPPTQRKTPSAPQTADETRRLGEVKRGIPFWPGAGITSCPTVSGDRLLRGIWRLGKCGRSEPPADWRCSRAGRCPGLVISGAIGVRV